MHFIHSKGISGPEDKPSQLLFAVKNLQPEHTVQHAAALQQGERAGRVSDQFPINNAGEEQHSDLW